ncbi:fibronectin type III domain-containing protein, partial [Winogradskyella poriferorum]|uniref:fibronectin type III domain-containing protein n=1 Tax=Winogradskyella poriferorum TaxID=307627 RepID=UPI003D650BF4
MATAYAQIAETTVNSGFTDIVETIEAKTEIFDLGVYKANASLTVHYHSVVLKKLKPDQLYVYRVGDGD